MKEVVPQDSRYIPFVQGKSCCVPTCISMIMYRHGLPLLPQELLGYHLGLIVDKDNRHLFWNPRTGKRPPAGWGTQMVKSEYSPNLVFKKLKIPLKVTFLPISNFDDKQFTKYLKEVELMDQDVVVSFDHRVLSKQRKTKHGEHQGHMCVIDRVDLKRNQVRLIDPSPTQPKWRVVSIKELKKALDWHHPKSAGFWQFELINK